ncbi:hypothetical protein CCP4SC76_1810003 [Gammaproteobacteria bacterium]
MLECDEGISVEFDGHEGLTGHIGHLLLTARCNPPSPGSNPVMAVDTVRVTTTGQETGQPFDCPHSTTIGVRA